MITQSKKIKIKGLNLIEIIFTVVIIGILVTITVVRFGPPREKVFDSEAQESLKLIQAAEKLYHTRFTGTYYPNTPGTPSPDMGSINSFLKLDLPTINSRWSYQTDSNGCVQAAPLASKNPSAYTWHMSISDDQPVSGPCP